MKLKEQPKPARPERRFFADLADRMAGELKAVPTTDRAKWRHLFNAGGFVRGTIEAIDRNEPLSALAAETYSKATATATTASREPTLADAKAWARRQMAGMSTAKLEAIAATSDSSDVLSLIAGELYARKYQAAKAESDADADAPLRAKAERDWASMKRPNATEAARQQFIAARVSVLKGGR